MSPFVPWEPKYFLIPEDEINSELALALVIHKEARCAQYDGDLIRSVIAETTWAIARMCICGDKP